jgi:hypothetical protein
MPVRSLHSSVLRWPDKKTVMGAFHIWAGRQWKHDPEISRIGSFGSYARGDWGTGSDLDIIMIVDTSELPFQQRPRQCDTTDLPVPADVVIYTRDEWKKMQGTRFYEMILHDAVWE